MNAFIFDMDGVIVDSMPLHTEAWVLYLEKHGVVAPDLVEKMHGRRNDDLVKILFGGGLTPEEIAGHGVAKESLFREMMQPRFHEFLVPGIVEFLAKWEGVPTGLASNAERANIDFVLDYPLPGGGTLRPRFQVVVDGQQVERPKPYPDIYLRAAELLGAAPGDCIVFEDSPTGIHAAVGAGAQVVAVRTHAGELPRTDFSISNFLDPALPTWIHSRDPRA